MSEIQDLSALKMNPLSFSSDHLHWKNLLLSYCWWETMCPLSGTLVHSSPVAAVSANIPHKKHALDMTTDLGLITHRKRLKHFNALFGDATVFLMEQKDISSQKNSRIKPQNKVKFKRYLRLLSSFSNSLADFTNKEGSSELDD